MVGLWAKYDLHKEILFSNNQFSNPGPISIPRLHHILKENKIKLQQQIKTPDGLSSSVEVQKHLLINTLFS